MFQPATSGVEWGLAAVAGGSAVLPPLEQGNSVSCYNLRQNLNTSGKLPVSHFPWGKKSI